MDIAVAQVVADDAMTTCSERWSRWPFCHEEQLSLLQRVGLMAELIRHVPRGSRRSWSVCKRNSVAGASQ
ncbi:MAG TPA: hypothetical protein VI452_13430 [Marmoricola sp.]